MDWSPILISMKTAGLSILITFFIGIFAAWAVVSLKNEGWRLFWDGVLTLPLVLPPTVAGFFLLYIFGVKRPVGQFFIDYFSIKIAFSWAATVIAAVVMSFPLMYRSARGAFEQVDQNLVAAARTLGMSEWYMDWSPILISMKTAGLSILITFFIGIFAAWAVVSLKNEGWRLFWDGVLTLPLVLPPTVAGFFLLYIFGVKRPVGQFFIDYFSIKIAFSWAATVIAAVVMSFPLMYRSARGAFEQVDQNLVAAARTLGMSEWCIFWKVLIANAVPGVVSGGVLAFARGLGEFGATAMIAGNIAGRTRTLPMAVYSEVAAGNMDKAYGYVAIIVVIAFISVFLMNWTALRTGSRRG